MDWRVEREEVLGNARRVLVKVGSAVLTSGTGLDAGVVDNLVAQIAQLHARGTDVVLVSSGAVAAGRAVLRQCCELQGMPHRQAASAVGQSRLMHCYDNAFAHHGIISAQMLLTRDDLRSRVRFLHIRNTFGALLGWHTVPIVNENDSVATKELEFGDNDSLASLLLNVVEADLFINLTSSGGVYAQNPDVTPGATVLECIEDVHSLDLTAMCGGKTSVGSGGMYSKLLAARRAAQLGVPTLILPGKKPDAMVRAFAGDEPGTWVRPERKVVSRRKFWLAYHAEPSGAIVVDQGAKRALSTGKSLLPAGIVQVEGSFGRGALVRIVGQGKTVIAVGLSNYSAADLRRVMGHHTEKLAEILGEHQYTEAVHRDNMLMDAVA